jgi:hypothetical protein
MGLDVPQTPPQIAWDLYAWAQAGNYRRLVLQHLHRPLSPRDLRKSIIAEYARMGANHVHATLRAMHERGVVHTRDGLWELTEHGRLLREHQAATGTAPRPPPAGRR